VVELLLVTPLAPALVVEVLPPSGGVGADGLEVPVLVGTDPDVDQAGGTASVSILARTSAEMLAPSAVL
jgi:hypothetical protein